MSLSSEMVRMVGEFEVAQAARSAAITGIQATVQRDMRQGRASRKRIMAECAKTMHKQLKEIFGEVGFIRGTARDLIERFADERAANTDATRAQLEGLASKLEKSVSTQLSEMATTREEDARRDSAAQQAYLRGLRRRVEAVLADAREYIAGLNHDRMRAARVWRQHLPSDSEEAAAQSDEAQADAGAKPAPRPRASAAKGKRKKKVA